MNKLDLYILNTVDTSIASTATPTLELVVGNEYDFEIVAMHVKIYKAADQTGPVLGSIRLSGGQYLTENPLDLNMFAVLTGAQGETDKQPLRVPWVGAILPFNTKIFIDVNNLSGNTITLQVAFIGRKIWKG